MIIGGIMAETLIKNFVNKFENAIIITTVVTEFCREII